VKSATAHLALFVFLLGTGTTGVAWGDPGSSPLPRRLSLAEVHQDTPPPYTPPGAMMVDPGAPPRDRPITERWWFWAAVGGVIVTTVVVILVAGDEPDPPDSILGNMDAFKDRR
jgi:hypothetical protein